MNDDLLDDDDLLGFDDELEDDENGLTFPFNIKENLRIKKQMLKIEVLERLADKLAEGDEL